MAIPKEVRQKAKRLRQTIEHHNYLYYSLDSPEIDDVEFDRLFQELSALEKEFPGLQTKDSPTTRVGGTRASYLPSAKHGVRMLSIRTAAKTDAAEIREFDAQIRRELSLTDEQPPIEYLAELKIDGAAISLRYEDGHLVRGATRGDGIIGEDVTQNVREIGDIPHSLNSLSPPALLEVRGEIFMSRNDFEELNKHLASTGGKTFKNPRNAAAGSIRQVDSSHIAGRRLSFLTHGFAEARGWVVPEKQDQILNALKKFGLPVSEKKLVSRGPAQLEGFYENVRNQRNDLDFDIDGVVYKVNRRDLQEELGLRDREPRWALAHKFPPERRSTTVLGIDPQVGRTGALTPVARLASVLVGGVNVTNATLHNQDDLESKDVRVGDTVIVQRAGDVIPEIVSVDLEKRPKDSKPYVMPPTCPICGSRVVRLSKERRLKTKVHVVKEAVYRCVGGLFCSAQRKRAIEHFVNRRAMSIDGFGEKLVEQVVDKKLVTTPADIYALTRDQLGRLDGIRETASLKLSSAIEVSKKTTLARLIYALGIPGVGEAIAKDIANKFGRLDLISRALPQVLQYLPGIGKELADSIHEFFETPHNSLVIEQLQERGMVWEEAKAVHESIAKAPTLASFIEILELPGIGSTSATALQRDFADIQEILRVPQNEVERRLRESGIPSSKSLKISSAIRKYFDSSENRKLAEKFDAQLREFKMHWLARSTTVAPLVLPLNGKTFVLTGRLPDLTKDEVKKKIEALGGKISSSVSSKTDYVVVGEDPGVKYDDAKRFKRPILDQKKLLELLETA